MSAEAVARRLDDATADNRLLDHPFYQAWAAGTLTREDLGFYAGQYWRQVEAFPGYLDALVERLPEGSVRDVIAENLSDERDDDHPGLWLDFASALGRDEGTVRASTAESETSGCVAAFAEATKNASLPFALGMLYGYESQTPAVAETKVAGLREHYGIAGDGARYFELHGELDIQHSNELARAIDEIAPDEASRDEAAAGARAGAVAIAGLLDGVARVRAIC